MTKQENKQSAPANPIEADEDQPVSLVTEFLWFLRENKKWWLIPLIAIFLLLGAVIFLGHTPLAPFLYTFL